jgi:hypothetical protein
MARDLQVVIAEKLQNPEYRQEYTRLRNGGPCVSCGSWTYTYCDECGKFAHRECMKALIVNGEYEGDVCPLCTPKE